jgi:hypothetical protein
MARRQPLTKARWMALQVVLVGVLAATVGLAALVKRGLEGSMDVKLASPATLATLSARLPAGWEYDAEVADAAAVISAHSPRSDDIQRRLDIYHLANPQGLKLEHFLSDPKIFHPDYSRDIRMQSPQAQWQWSGQAGIGGGEGIMLEGLRVPPNSDLDTYFHEVFIAGKVGRDVVIVKLRSTRFGHAESHFGDRMLARKLAESIKVEQPLDLIRTLWGSGAESSELRVQSSGNAPRKASS